MINPTKSTLRLSDSISCLSLPRSLLKQEEMKIYTRTGDDGTTSLVGGRRIPKQDIRIEAYGTVDELIAWIGLLRGEATDDYRKEILIYVQNQLMATAAALAHDSENPSSRLVLPDADAPLRLEADIDRMEALLPKLNSFILPGGNISASHCHITRCVCRRAERAVLRLDENEKVPESVRRLLNRLSDWLFVMGRLVSLETGNEDIKWVI